MTTVAQPGFGRQFGDIPTDGQNRVVRVADVDAHEGPVYMPGEDALYFTSLPRPGRISPRAMVKRLALDGNRFPLEADRVSVVDTDLVMPNGMSAGLDGSLIVCEQGSPATAAQLRRLDPISGTTTTIVDSWHGRRLNSPNDVVAKSDGTIWFTDPAYGYLQGFRPEPQVGDFVYRLDPASGSLSVVADSFSKPNSIALSPDETVLYVTDSGANQEPGAYYVNLPHHVIAFDVVDGRHLANQRLFAVITPDSLMASRSTTPAGCTSRRHLACRSSPPRATFSARSACPAPSSSPSAAPIATSCSSPRTPPYGRPRSIRGERDPHGPHQKNP